MQVIKSERTNVTPEIIFFPEEGKFQMDGECYPENPLPFFNPILATLKTYFDAHRPPAFEARMRIQYINSASTKGVRSLFSLFNDAGVSGTDVKVFWEYDPEDDAIEELGADLVEDFNHLQLERVHI